MRYLKWFGSGLLVWVLIGAVGGFFYPRSHQPVFIPTFSAADAVYLGLNPHEVFTAMLRDLKPKQIRLQANWNEIEATSGIYDFSDLDWYIDRAREVDVVVTLAVGRKLPHWPECHEPTWFAQVPSWETNDRILAMVRAVVTHYRTEPAIVRWQLENEPFFSFGNCQAPNWHRLVLERDMVKKLDPTRPILVTDSGELSSWWEAAGLGDELGVTMYRVTWNPVTGYFTYPLPALWYRAKAALVRPWVQRTIVSELQLEPWASHGLKNQTKVDIEHSLSLSQFRDNISYFRATGLPEAFLWGVEWWYYAKERLDEPDYWNEAQDLFSSSQSVD